MVLPRVQDDKRWLREHIKASLFSTVLFYGSMPVFRAFQTVSIGFIQLGILVAGVSAVYNYYVNEYEYSALRSVGAGVGMVVLNWFYLLFLILYYGEKVLREEIL